MRILACLLAILAASSVKADTAQILMQRNYDATRVSASSFYAAIELRSPSGQTRIRQTHTFTRLDGESNSRITRFLSPNDVSGTATLLIEHPAKDDEMWVYLPALKKVRRLVASNKRDSFVGTDLTFGDILGHPVANWKHRLISDSQINGKPCTLIESTPLNDTIKMQTGYARRISCISSTSGIALRTDFWDEYDKPLKWINASEVIAADQKGHWQPMRLESTNKQSGHQTIIRIRDFKSENNLKPDLFRAHQLEQDQ